MSGMDMALDFTDYFFSESIERSEETLGDTHLKNKFLHNEDRQKSLFLMSVCMSVAVTSEKVKDAIDKMLHKEVNHEQNLFKMDLYKKENIEKTASFRKFMSHCHQARNDASSEKDRQERWDTIKALAYSGGVGMLTVSQMLGQTINSPVPLAIAAVSTIALDLSLVYFSHKDVINAAAKKLRTEKGREDAKLIIKEKTSRAQEWVDVIFDLKDKEEKKLFLQKRKDAIVPYSEVKHKKKEIAFAMTLGTMVAIGKTAGVVGSLLNPAFGVYTMGASAVFMNLGLIDRLTKRTMEKEVGDFIDTHKNYYAAKLAYGIGCAVEKIKETKIAKASTKVIKSNSHKIEKASELFFASALHVDMENADHEPTKNPSPIAPMMESICKNEKILNGSYEKEDYPVMDNQHTEEDYPYQMPNLQADEDNHRLNFDDESMFICPS